MRNFPSESATLLLVEEPDARLLQWTADCGGTLVTNESTLRQTAAAQGVSVMTVHELALALAPKVRQGDEIEVQITKAGRNPDEGIAFLDDGTMVVVEGGQRHVGATITVTVTGVLQTAAGKMVFAIPSNCATPDPWLPSDRTSAESRAPGDLERNKIWRTPTPTTSTFCSSCASMA